MLEFVIFFLLLGLLWKLYCVDYLFLVTMYLLFLIVEVSIFEQKAK